MIGLRLDPEEAEEVVRGRALPTDRVVLYSATWCPDCRKVKKALDESPLAYCEVDLDTDLKAEALVLEKSGGRRVVPTLEFGGAPLRLQSGPQATVAPHRRSFLR